MGARHRSYKVCADPSVTLNLKVPLTFKTTLRRHALARGTTMTRVLIDAVAALDRELGCGAVVRGRDPNSAAEP
jgi:hypothetical protein